MTTIRLLHPSHTHAASEVTIAQMNALLTELNPALAPITADTLHAAQHDGTNVIVIAESNGVVVGMAMLARYYRMNGDRVGMIETVVVHHQHRRQGIARMLMERLIGIARQSGVSRIMLTSDDARTAAHKLYESMGFVDPCTNLFELLLTKPRRA